MNFDAIVLRLIIKCGLQSSKYAMFKNSWLHHNKPLFIYKYIQYIQS